MITASLFTIEMRGKTENIHNTIFTQFTTFLSIMSLYGQSISIKLKSEIKNDREIKRNICDSYITIFLF